MIRQLSSTFILFGIMGLAYCQTPQNSTNSRSEGQPEPTLRTYEEKIDPPREIIDLSQVKMVPMLDPDGRVIKITTNEDGKPVALLSLEYSKSGLDVIDAIQRGEILEHFIIVRDEKGAEIGRAPINILQYEVEELASNKGEHKILFTNSGSEINIKKTNELPPIERRGKVRVFKNNEIIPQYVELKRQPTEGSFVSAYIELIYAKPYAESICKNLSIEGREGSVKDQFCSGEFHSEVKKDTEEVIKEKQSVLTEAVSNMKESTSIPKDYREKLIFSPKKTVDEYRDSIKGKVENQNTKKLGDLSKESDSLGVSSGSKYFYREWRLISSPQFFEISTRDTPRKELRRKVETDYTHFENGEQSQEAEVENVVIEVNQPENIKEVVKADLPVDSKKVSLNEAKKQEIGVGSNCKVYLKSGKYFPAKLITLEGYHTIQVEVNGQPMEVPKKDIEVIYFPKASTWE